MKRRRRRGRGGQRDWTQACIVFFFLSVVSIMLGIVAMMAFELIFRLL